VTRREQIAAVADLGFTERQAGFLVTVLIHAGVCVRRQYCAYAHILRGQKGPRLFLAPGGQTTDDPIRVSTSRQSALPHSRKASLRGDRRTRQPQSKAGDAGPCDREADAAR
jgi:hypothetical protein